MASTVQVGQTHHSLTILPLPFDLRIRRDLVTHRLWRRVIGRALGTLARLSSDMIGAALAAAIGSAMAGSEQEVVYQLPLILVLVVAGQGAMGSYAHVGARTRARLVSWGVILTLAALAVLGQAYPGFDHALTWYLSFGIAAVWILPGGRWVVVQLIRCANRLGFGLTRTVIAGVRDDAWQILDQLRLRGEDGVQVIGHVASDGSADPTALGDVADLGRLLDAHDIDLVIISPQLHREIRRDVVRQCSVDGVTVTLAPSSIEGLADTRKGRGFSNWPKVEPAVPRPYLSQVIAKRIIDILGATAGLLLLSPVFALIAMAIKLDSRGPVFFRQSRSGLGGRSFGMWKFRTMRVDAECALREDPDLYQKFVENNCKLPANEDPRISRFGAFLRRTSLDELPQLINVLIGQMSLVGPRPLIGPELEYYGSQAVVLFGVKPGMTGYWQVNGRSEIRYPERAEMDVHYITHWSLAFDLKILWQTGPQVVRRKGAF